MIVGPGNQVLLSYRQESPADHVELGEVLKALGIQGGPPSSSDGVASGGGPSVVCDEDVSKKA